ncbi:MAG: anhydro-N-acetylmuramic acid kinase [Candidatus Hydrogenedentota bacterium]|nr:MAG: anhydro-N-acetylmuramic acid kinase [Candidatus Hydrogenedentota bacterium]
MTLALGVLSGTSRDGIDVGLVRMTSRGPRLLKGATARYSRKVRDMLRRIPDLSLEETAILDRMLGSDFSRAVERFLVQNKILRSKIAVIGYHGQTLYHRSRVTTVQAGDPARLAAETGIPVAADFRRSDMAVGGAGAPLAPVLDRCLVRLKPSLSRGRTCFLNIGGIANGTILEGQTILAAYDFGPGNAPLDVLANNLLRRPFDHRGRRARRGRIRKKHIERAMDHPYFRRRPPKSTGLEEFGSLFVKVLFGKGDLKKRLPPEDLLATMTEIVAASIARELKRFRVKTTWVSGGGAHNQFLLERLRLLAKEAEIRTLEEAGMSVDFKEAVLFAYLGYLRWKRRRVDLRGITGARRPALLGGLWLP